MKFANLAAAIILICAASFPLNAGDKETYGNPDLMVNVYGRDFQLLNGKWDAIIDLYDQGRGKKVWENRKPAKADEFFEYSFDGGLRLDVPGDFNSQLPQLQ